MSAKLKATAPLALAIAVIAFVYVEFAANFTFHWATSGDLGNGLHLPSNFQIVIPAAFVSWGMFFALGADNAALRTTALNCLFGSVAAFVLFLFVDIVKGVPDFWAISLGVALLAFIIVLASGGLPQINVPVIFTAFGSCVFFWIATGLDGWAPNGGAVGNSVAALSKPATAGTGAFGGVLSVPFTFVALDVFVTLIIGCLCGALSVRLASVLTPKPSRTQSTTPPRGTAPV